MTVNACRWKWTCTEINFEIGLHVKSGWHLRKVNRISLANEHRHFGQCPVAKGLQDCIMEERHDTVVTYYLYGLHREWPWYELKWQTNWPARHWLAFIIHPLLISYWKSYSLLALHVQHIALNCCAPLCPFPADFSISNWKCPAAIHKPMVSSGLLFAHYYFSIFTTLEKFLPSSGRGLAAAFALPTTLGCLINLTHWPMTLTRTFLLTAGVVIPFQWCCFIFIRKGLWKHRGAQCWCFTNICINVSLKIHNAHFHCLPSKPLYRNRYTRK